MAALVESKLGEPGQLPHLLNVGAALTSLGRYEEALAALGQVPADHPDRVTARQDMAVILLNNLHHTPEGLAALREAASLATNPEQVSFLQAEVARIEKSQSGAIVGGQRSPP